MIREHADEWKVDKELIFIHGASAGGHLAASYGVFWNQEFMTSGLQTTAGALKVKGLLLSYPVITSDPKYAHTGSFKNLLGDRFAEDRVRMSLEYQVTEAMPPCFIWHTAKDSDPKYAHTGSFKNLLGDRFAEDRVRMSLEYQVTEAMPPCFIWHTAKDATVPVENSLLMAMALQKAKVPVELHIFPEGEHGLSRADSLVERVDGSGIQKECSQWLNLADSWIRKQCGFRE